MTSYTFDVVLATSIAEVEYDIQEAQRKSCVEYEINGNLQSEEGEIDLTIGDNIPVEIARDVDLEVEGYVVPDHMLGLFINRFPDKEIFRRQQ